jgi:Tol biopolymer transport system component
MRGLATAATIAAAVFSVGASTSGSSASQWKISDLGTLGAAGSGAVANNDRGGVVEGVDISHLRGTIAFSDLWGPNDGSSEILVIDVTDRSVRSLTENVDCHNAYSPAWSRGGSMIAFVCDGLIWVIWHDGTGARAITGAEGNSPSWSPNRREIAFDRDDGWIWIASIWSDRMHKLTRGEAGGVSWSRDGLHIALSRKGRDAGIWIVRVDGRGLRRLTQHTDYEPAFSPDGRKIAFKRGKGIFVMSAKGGAARRIRGSVGGGPAWSPDSHWIATMVDDSGQWGYTEHGVWVTPVDGGRARHLVGASEPYGLSWGP